MSKVNILSTIGGALLILATTASLMISSARTDTAVMDELAHIPAGFGLLQRDYRLNPEHPPLVKFISALSARIITQPFFPTTTESWRTEVNGQWDHGTEFLYHSSNDADAVVFAARLPMILLTLLFASVLFFWTKKRYGTTAGFFALLLFSFSPTILAHGRLVTTDLAAGFGFFIALTTFLTLLARPTGKHMLLSGAALGVALLMKFSVLLLLPLGMLLFSSWIIALPKLHLHERMLLAGRRLLTIIPALLIAFVLVLGTYAFLLQNYPHKKHISDAREILFSYPHPTIAKQTIALIERPLTRPLGHYALGALMVHQRATNANTTYFLGSVAGSAPISYFPLLYLLKESLALHILTLIALFSAWRRIRSSPDNRLPTSTRVRAWIHKRFSVFSLLFVVTAYTALLLYSSLNIGVRHLLPILPFIYILIARAAALWVRRQSTADPQNWQETLRNLYVRYIKSLPKVLILGLLFVWLIGGTIFSAPHFLSHYNELAGGSRTGYQYAVDSNYDWGQDLKRLVAYVERNDIEHISLDYFGGGEMQYYLGEKVEPWWSSKGPAEGWFAVSATFREEAFGTPARGFERSPEESYNWLRPHTPVARAGHSIFIYNLPPPEDIEIIP